jgi:glycosyltransferase involved in cell wall biosynthesis
MKKPPVVVHYNHTEVVAGAERVLLNLLPGLRARGFRSVVLCPHGALEEEMKRCGIETQRCNRLQARFTWNPLSLSGYIRSLFWSIRDIRNRLRVLQPDIVHANSVRAGLVATVATTGLAIPVLWHVHDTMPEHPISWAIRVLAAASSRTSQIAVSHATAATFAGVLWRKSLAAKTKVLHNVISAHAVPSTKEQRAALRAELGVGGDRFLVGCIGQICPRKNQVEMVEIFAQLLLSRPDTMLLIAGAALFPYNVPYEDKLKHRIQELGIGANVLLLGSRSDVPRILETIDLLVLPSHNEPFPMIILEAMGASLPVVAFAVDGVPELIADGRTGWLVPAGDAIQMARKILWAERNPEQRARLGAAAHESILHEHSPDLYADRFATILQEGCVAEPAAAIGYIPLAAAKRSDKSDQPA